MTIHFQCPACGKALAVRDEYAGKTGKCTCGAAVTVPAQIQAVIPVGQIAAADDMIRFACGTCGKRIKVPLSRAGQKGKCPQCKNIITIPTVSEPEPVEQASPSPLTLKHETPAAIRIQCAMCGTIAEVPLYQAGNLIECRKCRSFIEVPFPKGTDEETVKAAQIAAAERKRADVCTGRTVCPSCNKALADDATVCVSCGIYIRSGRPILSTRGVDEDELNDKARAIILPISFVVCFGLYPVYSEVLEKCRPYAVWAITAVTILISAWFYALDYNGSPKMQSLKNLMLWAGKGQPESERIEMFYEISSYGDTKAFNAKREELKSKVPEEELNLAAMNSLRPDQQCFGEFRFYQLITHAFLHGGVLHLAGNLLFLFIFGSRVCSVIGNLWTPILYFILAIGAGFTHLVMSGMEPPTPMLGASGAIMGMAGVYLVLFPIQRVFMAAWIQWGILTGFHLSFKTFAVRGLWVVLFYICLDIISILLSSETGTAHWAHIGGFIWGIAAGFILLISRAAYSGSDILSLIFGKYAWRLIGTPANRG